MTPTIIPFSSSFVAHYDDAFTELLRLGTEASRDKINGIQTDKKDCTAKSLLRILEALDCAELTDDEIESLEGCLRSLNESLAVPTVHSPLPDSLFPKRYVMRGGQLNFTVTGQDISYQNGFTIAANNGLFVENGQDAGLIYATPVFANYSITADAGSFVETGQDVDLPVTQEQITIKSGIQVEAFGPQTFGSAFDNGDAPSFQEMFNTGFLDHSSQSMNHGDPVYCVVKKYTNGGIAQAAVSVQFFKNGVLMATQFRNTGEDCFSGIPLDYTFTSVNFNDVLETLINED